MPKNKTATIKLSKWDIFNRFVTILQALVLMATLYLVFYQVPQLTRDINDKSANLTIILEEKLSDSRFFPIINALENNKPILIENNGSVSRDDLEDFIGVYETISNMYETGLLNKRMICIEFAPTLISVYRNQEIAQYLGILRTSLDDYSLYTGFERLAKELLPFDKKNCT